MASDPLGFSTAIWKQFADLGWLALPIAEAYGGLGGGAIEIGILMEAFGRGLVAEPYLSTVVLGAGLIAECGSEAQKQAMLPKIADGSLYLAFAHSERAARFDLAEVETTAKKTADGWRLDGHKIAVLDGAAARPDHRLGARRQATTVRLAKCACSWCRPARPASPCAISRGSAAAAPAISISPDVRLPADALLGDGGDALPAIEAVVDRAMAALGAEAVGIMQTLLDTTLEYTKIRKQFGRPLSANQVIRHRLADMAMQCDEARSMALRAALMADAEPVARSRAASGAKAKIGKCARFVAEQSVQLARRDGRHRRARHRLLFQAAARLRHAVRRQRPSLSPPRRARRAGNGLKGSAHHGSQLQRRRARLREGGARLHRRKISRRK